MSTNCLLRTLERIKNVQTPRESAYDLYFTLLESDYKLCNKHLPSWKSKWMLRGND